MFSHANPVKEVRPWRPAPWNDPASLLRVNLQDEWAPVRFRGRFFRCPTSRFYGFYDWWWHHLIFPYFHCRIKISSTVIVGHFAMADWRRRRSSFSWIRSQELKMQQTWVLTWLVLTFKTHIFIEVKLTIYNFETRMFSYLLEWRWFRFCSPKFKHLLPVDIVKWVNIPLFTQFPIHLKEVHDSVQQFVLIS